MKLSRLLFAGLIIIVLSGAGWFGWQQYLASNTKTTVAASSTTTVTRGSIVSTVSASGNVSAPKTSALTFENSGRVTKVNVQVGDTVKKGAVLMELDTTKLKQSVTEAQANLDSAKAALASAQAEYAQIPNTLIVAKLALDQAKITLQSAQAAYDTIAWRGDVGGTTQAATLQSASIAYQSALASYNKTAATINDSSLKSAQASYTSAQITLEQAQRDLDEAKLVAPYDGIVSAVNYVVGDMALSTAVTVVDTTQLQVKVTVAEVDIAKIKVGEISSMTLDALTGKKYNAKVIAINPVGTVTSGVVNYSVTLEISDSDGSIKPGMTATLNIEVERHDNALLVPAKAVKTQGTQKVVSVESQGQVVQKIVTTGLSSDSSIEITSGLQEGDVVVLNATSTSTSTTTTNNTSTGGMGAMGIMGVGGAGGLPPGAP
jgi:RND family efflux transporter MFP subunit